jgi:hypothetical protein
MSCFQDISPEEEETEREQRNDGVRTGWGLPAHMAALVQADIFRRNVLMRQESTQG